MTWFRSDSFIALTLWLQFIDQDTPAGIRLEGANSDVVRRLFERPFEHVDEIGVLKKNPHLLAKVRRRWRWRLCTTLLAPPFLLTPSQFLLQRVRRKEQIVR
jgi:hypothetical protein